MSMVMTLGLMHKEALTISQEISLDTTTPLKGKYLMMLTETVSKDLL